MFLSYLCFEITTFKSNLVYFKKTLLTLGEKGISKRKKKSITLGIESDVLKKNVFCFNNKKIRRKKW